MGVLASVLLVCLTWTSGAHAQQKTLSGRWTATAMTTQWVVGDWGDACGPRPGGGGAPGGTVRINQQGGELVVIGGTRSWRTNTCWDSQPVRSHSGGQRGWRTVCGSSPGDPRQAKVIMTMSATDDAISFSETGQYQFVIKGQNCTASVRRSRSYKILKRDGEKEPEPEPKPAPLPAPTPEPEPAPKPTPRCASPGDPARLEVRPKRKLVRPGDSFQFRAVVLDDQGCRVGLAPTWTVTSGAKQVALDGGEVRVLDEATEGEVKLTAAVRGRSVSVTLEVASKERYEALLAGGTFNAEGEVDEAAIAVIASGSIGSREVVSEGDGGSGALILGFAGVLALVLGGLGVGLAVRGRRRAREREDEQRAEKAPGGAAASSPPADDAKPAPQMICPVCGEMYAPGSEFCGKDAAKLLPVN